MSTVPVQFDLLPDRPFSAINDIKLQNPASPFESLTLYPETATVGLGRRQILPDTRISINAWPTLSPGDNYYFYAGSTTTPLAAGIVTDIRPIYTLTFPGTLMPEGEVSMFARVVRAGSGQESRSEPQTVLVKTTIPGGPDYTVNDSWVTGLTMRIENLPEGSVIDANVAAAGMWCLIDNYANMRENDEVALFVSGSYVYHTVSPAEAAGPGPLRVFIPASVVQAGNQLGPFQIAFKVTDVVDNVSGGVDALYPFSRPYILDSEQDINLLMYPLLLADGDEAPIVDLGTQSNAVFSVLTSLPRIVPAPSPLNQIHVLFTITDANGVVSTVRLPPVNDRNRTTETIPVDNALIRRLGGSSIRISFETQTATGTLLRRSGSFLVQVRPVPPLVRDFTSFTDNAFNGWLPGHATSPRDLRYIVQQGVLGLFNMTDTNNSAGVILRKPFTNMQAGARYRFSAQVSRWISQFEAPILSLATSQGPLTSPVQINTMFPSFVTISGEFTSFSQEIECMLISSQPSGSGNDYAMANFEIIRL